MPLLAGLYRILFERVWSCTGTSVLTLACSPPPSSPPPSPPPPRVPWRRFSIVRPSCGNNSLCATDLAPRAARSSWRPLTSDSSLLICFCSACTSDAACWLRRPPVRRRALRESTTSRSALIVLALSVSLHRSNIIFASDIPATNSFHLFTRDGVEN